jgi:hypothetical protein
MSDSESSEENEEYKISDRELKNNILKCFKLIEKETTPDGLYTLKTLEKILRRIFSNEIHPDDYNYIIKQLKNNSLIALKKDDKSASKQV